jgi:hypothetical protein
LLNISDTHHPVAGHRREAGLIRDIGEVAKHRQIFVEIGGFGRVHTESIAPLAVLPQRRRVTMLQSFGENNSDDGKLS